MGKPTSTSPRRWRVDKGRNTARGRSYQLASGSSGRGKKTISLGVVPRATAERACSVLQLEEERTFGTARYDRLFDLIDAGERAMVIEMLLDESEAFLLWVEAERLPWHRRPLREYVDEVYGPHRELTKPRTWRTERNDWSAHILPALGDTALDDIDEFVVDEFLTETLRKVKPLGAPATPNMRRKCRNAISAMLTFAYRKRHRTIPRPTWFELEGTGARSLRDKTLTINEVHRLIEHAPGHSEMKRGRTWAGHKQKFQSLFACLFNLGLRPSEAAGMRWEDVDWIRGQVYISGATKTAGSRSTIRLHQLARRHLAQWWVTRGRPTEGLIHPAPGGRVYETTGSTGFSKSLKRAARAAGIDKPVTPYWGRHTYGTRSIEGGMSVDTVAKVLRHSTPEMVRKHYDHGTATTAPDIDIADDVFGR